MGDGGLDKPEVPSMHEICLRFMRIFANGAKQFQTAVPFQFILACDEKILRSFGSLNSIYGESYCDYLTTSCLMDGSSLKVF